MSFAVSILKLIETFPKVVGARIVAGQLAEAATSVGANYRAVCNARSDREFVAKLCVVNEEADESVRSYLTEALQLRAIFSRSLKTIRARLRATGPTAK